MTQLQDFPQINTNIAELSWIEAPCALTRDSCATDEANYDYLVDLLEAIDESGLDWEEVCFPHWSCGWTMHIFVRPGSDCALMADVTAARLKASPCLVSDEMLHDYESQEESESNAV